MTVSLVFPFVALALYGASCALYLALIAVGVQKAAVAPQLARAARLLLIGACAAQAIDIGVSCVHGMHPASSAREALFFFSWLMVATYLVVTWRQPVPLAGALLTPVSLVLQVAARVGPRAGAVDPAASKVVSTLFSSMHIALASAGVALFGVAAVASVVYLRAEGKLKSKSRRGGLGNLPPLEALDRLSRRCIRLGFPIYTIALLTGAVWLSRLPPQPGELPPLLRPQYALAVIAWLLYAGLILLRFLLGWRGRRAALVTLGGFAASLSVVLFYYVRDLFRIGGGP